MPKKEVGGEEQSYNMATLFKRWDAYKLICESNANPNVAQIEMPGKKII